MIDKLIETYTNARKAESLLNNAVDAVDYARAAEQVRSLGISPEEVRAYKEPESSEPMN